MVENLNEQRFFEHKLAKSRALPTLNAFVNYGSSAFSDSFSFLGSEQDWFDSSVLGFDLSIPLFSSGKRSATTARAKIALEKAKTQNRKPKRKFAYSWKVPKVNTFCQLNNTRLQKTISDLQNESKTRIKLNIPKASLVVLNFGKHRPNSMMPNKATCNQWSRSLTRKPNWKPY